MEEKVTLAVHEAVGRHEDYFDYLHLRFNVTRARSLAEKHPEKSAEPAAGWISPFARGQAPPPPREPILFVTVVLESSPVHILIDGDQVVRRAVKDRKRVRFAVLDFADTMSILVTHAKVRRRMREEAKKIGLACTAQ